MHCRCHRKIVQPITSFQTVALKTRVKKVLATVQKGSGFEVTYMYIYQRDTLVHYI